MEREREERETPKLGLGKKNLGISNPGDAPEEIGKEGEWIPVIRGKGGFKSKRWDIVKKGFGRRGEITSFFFSSIPDSFNAKDLHEVFSRFGEVDEVVIPMKKDVRGKRYGFVRFFNVVDSSRLACKLDNIFVENVKLQVNLPRFSRNSKLTAPNRNQFRGRRFGWEEKSRVGEGEERKGSSSRFVDSFAKVVTGGNKGVIMAEVVRHCDVGTKVLLGSPGKVKEDGQAGWSEAADVNKMVKKLDAVKLLDAAKGVSHSGTREDSASEAAVALEFNSDLARDNPNILKAYVGVVRTSGLAFSMQKIIQAEGYFDFSVKPLGPNLCIFEDVEEGAVEAFVAEGHIWWSKWFTSIDRWKPGHVDEERLMWVRCLGIPCHVWTDDFFGVFAGLFGSYVRSDCNTASRKVLDSARLLVRTKRRRWVNDLFQVKINGLLFDISVVEEVGRVFSEAADNCAFNSSNEALSSDDELGDVGVETHHVFEEDDLILRENFEQPLGHRPAAVQAESVAFPGVSRGQLRSVPQDGGYPLDAAANWSDCHGVRTESVLHSAVNSVQLVSQVGGMTLDKGKANCCRSGNCWKENSEAIVLETEQFVSSSSETAGSCVRVSQGRKRLLVGAEGSVGATAELEKGESVAFSVDVGAGGRLASGSFEKTVQCADPARSGGYALDSEATLSGTVMGLKFLVGGQRLGNSKDRRFDIEFSGLRSGNRGSNSDRSETISEFPLSNFKLNRIISARGNIEGDGQLLSSYDSVEGSDSVKQVDEDEVNSGVARMIWNRAKCLGLTGGGSDSLQISAIKMRELADKFGDSKADVCFIQETKIHAIDNFPVDSVWSDSLADWSSKWAVGRSGGILTLWKKKSFILVSSFVGEGFLGIHVLWSGFNLFLVNVYSSCFIEKKKAFWGRLVEFKAKFPDGLWCVGGDFNTVRVKVERKGISNNFNLKEAEDFEDFIRSMDLVDVPLINKKFTWFNLDGSACSRLDRFLISEKLFDLWGVGGIVVGDRSISDHCPIWLNCKIVDWGPKPFKFFKGWCEHDEFTPLVRDVWKNTFRGGKASYILKEKLLAVKIKLKSWNKEVFGMLDLNVDKAVGELNSLDLMVADLAEDGLVDSVRRNREVASKEVWDTMFLRDNFLRQKARCNWIRLGDTNSKFFHSVMKGRFRRNNIASLITPRGRLEGVEDIKSEIFNHFKSRFTEPMENRPTLDGLNFNVLSVEDRDLLEAPFQVDEIKEIVWLSDCDKSPGPDGFPLGFLKKCWNFVKDDVVNFVQEFYVRGVLPRSATTSFLALIPKAPKCVLEEIIKIQRNFLWGDGGGSRKMCWVSWDKICLRTEEGGLGVKNVEWFNLALMSKWGWRFLNDKHAIWFKLLQFRYGSGLQSLGDVVSKSTLSNYSLWWRDIRLVCGTPLRGHDWFGDSISCKLGRGNSILFWKHCWLGNSSLKLLFPRLFEVCSFPNALVINCGLWENGGWSWKVGVDSTLLVGELLEDWKELIEILKDVKPCTNGVDKLIWWRDVGGFSVRNAFKRLYTLNLAISNGSDFRFCELKRLWKATIPWKVKLFGWRWILGALPTRKELWHRGVILGVEASLCPLCDLEEEFVGHLFLKCGKVKFIWKEVFSWFGLDFDVLLRSSDIDTIVTGEDVLLFLLNSLDGRVKSYFFAFIWPLVCWSIWNARNSLVFEHSNWNVVEILLLIKSIGWDWISILSKGNIDITRDLWFANPANCIGL
ncbi:hypothetical protein KIW84_035011 [Lathyrus oleraceus]|uniref:RRM domain-containing protein n=1 Tax=Pisum sativum TaxID=3888 RepID=A0A9D4Y5E2_PEA|nr:hypothetical protein KIW84_035011 [Pisum sativum]